MQVQDTADVRGVQSFNIVLNGRSYISGQRSIPWREVFKYGDLAYLELVSYEPTGIYDPYTTAVGMVTRVEESETATSSGYQLTTTLQCESFHHMLTREAIQYWLFYGSAYGFARARTSLNLNDISGKLDSVFANFMKKVVFPSEFWQRLGGVQSQLSYAFTSLDPNVPIKQELISAEGSVWSILQRHADTPLHEMFCACVAPGEIKGKETHTASALRGESRCSTTFVLRPSPFPFCNVGGDGNLSEWDALPLHDFTEYPKLASGTRSMSEGTTQIYNFFVVVPEVLNVTDKNALALGVAVANNNSVRDDGYGALRVKTSLMFDEEADDQNLKEKAQELSWRLAGQWSHMERYLAGSVSVPLAVRVQPGSRLKALIPYGDTTQFVEGYVAGRTHTVQREGGSSTTIQLERGLTDNLYADAGFFGQGLSEVSISTANDTVSVKDVPQL